MNDQIIPNAVGRLDDVVEAIRDVDIIAVLELLHERRKQVWEKIDHLKKLHEKAVAEDCEIMRFMDLYAENSDFRHRAREACGGFVDGGQ